MTTSIKRKDKVLSMVSVFVDSFFVSISNYELFDFNFLT